MKIYIDWKRMEWYTDEQQVLMDLADHNELQSYSDFLADEYANCLDELLNLSEEEKIDLHERYEMNLKSEFEDKVRYNMLNYTVLNINSDDIVTVNEMF